MLDSFNFVWVRYRTMHSYSSGYGDWCWEEFVFPAECTTAKQQNKFFREEIIDDLKDRLSTGSEHWREIEWEIIPVPQHIVMKHISRLRRKIETLTEDVKRLESTVDELSIVDLTAEVTCRQWPRCGCLKQSASPECRPPYRRKIPHD